MTKKKYAKLQEQWKAARDAAYAFQTEHPETYLSADRKVADRKLVRECDRLWHVYHRIDHRLYRYEQKLWRKTWSKLFLEPYSLFDFMPEVVNSLVQRFYEYWTHGYNVHIVDEDQSIGNTIRQAAKFGSDAIKAKGLLYEGVISYDLYKSKLVSFFKYVAQNCDKWGD